VNQVVNALKTRISVSVASVPLRSPPLELCCPERAHIGAHCLILCFGHRGIIDDDELLATVFADCTGGVDHPEINGPLNLGLLLAVWAGEHGKECCFEDALTALASDRPMSDKALYGSDQKRPASADTHTSRGQVATALARAFPLSDPPPLMIL
jgi:hypothetical protein